MFFIGITEACWPYRHVSPSAIFFKLTGWRRHYSKRRVSYCRLSPTTALSDKKTSNEYLLKFWNFQSRKFFNFLIFFSLINNCFWFLKFHFIEYHSKISPFRVYFTSSVFNPLRRFWIYYTPSNLNKVSHHKFVIKFCYVSFDQKKKKKICLFLFWNKLFQNPCELNITKIQLLTPEKVKKY